MAYKFTRKFSNFGEFKKTWANTSRFGRGLQRDGQAFWNKYGKKEETFPELFYEPNWQKAMDIAWEHICEYQHRI